MKIGIIEEVLKEATSLESTENPFVGAGLQVDQGGTIVGKLLPEELNLIRLSCVYHDKMVEVIAGRPQSEWSQETQNLVDQYTNLKELTVDIATKNIFCRFGWKFFEIAFLEDLSIVAFPPKKADLTPQLRAYEIPQEELNKLLGVPALKH